MSYRPIFFAVLCVWGFCLSFVAAAPEMFVGGSFDRAGRSYSPEFAIYDEAGSSEQVGGWVKHPAAGSRRISDMDIAGGGVFAGIKSGGKRDWNQETSLSATGVVYFDGQHWVAIREAPRQNVDAVACFDADNCYVVGQNIATLHGRLGPSDPNAYVDFLVHYQWNGTEWLWVRDDTDSWTFNGTRPHPAGTVRPKTFKITNIGDTKQFWVLVNSEVWRGSAADDGWVLFTDNLPGSSIEDYDIDESGDKMYVVGDIQFYNAVATGLTDPTPNNLDWNPFCQINETHIDYLERIALSHDASTRYLAGYWLERPGGSDLPHVLSQTENHEPVPLGLPFHYHGISWPGVGTYLTVDSDDAPNIFSSLIIGTDWIMNPDDLLTQRPTRNVYYTAKWSSADSRWVQPFGGGLDDEINAYAYDAENGRWFFAGGFDFVFDLVGSAVWWDNEETLREANQPNPWNTLIYQSLWKRAQGGGRRGSTHTADPGSVHEILYHSQYPDLVVVAGDFDGVGATDEDEGLGGIFATNIVGSENDNQLFSIGGGLWSLHYDTPNDRVGFLVGGSVYSVAVASLLGESSSYLYAGGAFQRTKSGTCLHNIARINLNTLQDQPDTAVWEDVAGGCDGEVEDMLYRWGNLYVTGGFRYCGTVRVNGIAKLSWVSRGGAMVLEWSALNFGLDDSAYGVTLEPWADGFVVGGYIYSAGGIPGNPMHWSIIHERFSQLAPTCLGECQDERTFSYPFPSDSAVVSLRRNGRKDRLYAVVITGDLPCCPDYSSDNYIQNVIFWDGQVWREVSPVPHQSNDAPTWSIGKFLNRNLTAERTVTLQDRIMLIANHYSRTGPWSSDSLDENVGFGAYHEDYDNVVDSHFCPVDNVRTIAIPEPSYTSSASSLQSFFSLLSCIF